MSTMGNGKSNALYEADVANYNRGDIRSDNMYVIRYFIPYSLLLIPYPHSLIYMLINTFNFC